MFIKGNAYYIVGDGEFADHTLAHINEAISDYQFDVTVRDLRENIGILSVQGPNRYLFVIPFIILLIGKLI